MDEAAMLMAIAATRPDPSAIRLTYADWLEERGDERAEFVRLEEAARHRPCWTDSVWGARERRRQLRARCEPAWLQAMGYAQTYQPLFSEPLPEHREHRWRLFQEFAETWHNHRLNERDGFEPQDLVAIEKRLGIVLPAAMREFYRLAGRWPPEDAAHGSILGLLRACADPPGVEFRHPPPLEHDWLALSEPPTDDPPIISADVAADDLYCSTFSAFVLAMRAADTVLTWPHRRTCLWQFWPAEHLTGSGLAKCQLPTTHLGDMTLGEGPDLLLLHSVGVGELTIAARTPAAFDTLPAGLC